MTVKVVRRDVKSGKQQAKKIYVGDAWKKYASELINRWVWLGDIEVYDMRDNEWVLWYTMPKPRTEREATTLAQTNKYMNVEYYVKNYL